MAKQPRANENKTHGIMATVRTPCSMVGPRQKGPHTAMSPCGVWSRLSWTLHAAWGGHRCHDSSCSAFINFVILLLATPGTSRVRGPRTKLKMSHSWHEETITLRTPARHKNNRRQFGLPYSASGEEIIYFWGLRGPFLSQNLLEKVGGFAPHLFQ